jgi:hypothetical protein
MRFHSTEFDFYPERAFRPRPCGGMTLEGGKSSNVPAPDPRLVEAQIRSMGFQDDAIKQIMGNANAMMPLQREQMQFGLDSARTAYGQSQDDRQFALGRRGALSGMQDTMLADARSFNGEDRANQLSGEAQGDVNQAFANVRGQSARSMGRMGVNPSSGRAASIEAQTSMAQATALAGASQRARAGARAEGFALTDRASNALSGFPAMASMNTGAGAGFGMAGLGVANQGLAGMNSGFGAGGQLAGNMGNNATGMFGAQANFKLGSDKQAADNDPFASLLGAGAQLGVAAIGKYSDRRLKTDIEQVGIDEATGLSLYNFRYIDGTGQMFRGVMADEVLAVLPSAVFTMPDGFMAVDYAQLGFEMVAVEGETA